MTRFARLQGAWEYVYGTFRIRRLLLLALIALSVALGPFIFFLPFWLRMDLAYIYAGAISVTGFFMYGAFRHPLESLFGSVFLGWKYPPKELTPEEYVALGVPQMLNQMGIRKRVRVFVTSNPLIEGPFTNALTNKVYLPTKWVNRFPRQEIRAVLGHELGHVKTQGKANRDFALGVGVTVGLSLLIAVFSIQLVDWVFEFAVAFLMLTAISWRGERRADMEGAKVTGPEGLISVFEQLRAESGKDDASETHPSLTDRIARLSVLLDPRGVGST